MYLGFFFYGEGEVGLVLMFLNFFGDDFVFAIVDLGGILEVIWLDFWFR